MQYNSGLYSFTLLADYGQLAGGGPSGSLRVWDYRTTDQIFDLKGCVAQAHRTIHTQTHRHREPYTHRRIDTEPQTHIDA